MIVAEVGLGMADRFKVYSDARSRIRDTAKWIVTILGSAIVLIIGGGLIANLQTVELGRLIIAAVCLLVLTGACVYPLIKVVDILVPPFVSFNTMAIDSAYQGIRNQVDQYLLETQPTKINSVQKLSTERAEYITQYDHAAYPYLKSSIKIEWMEVEDVIREVVEIGAIRKLEERFEEFKARMALAGCIAAACLVALLVVAHRSPTDYRTAAPPPGGPAESRVVFPSGRACTTNPESPSLQATVDALAVGLRANGHLTLRVTGSADTQPLGIEARQIYGNNVALALARAHCVAGALQSQLAVKGLYVSTVVAVRGPRDRRQADADRSVEIKSEP